MVDLSFLYRLASVEFVIALLVAVAVLLAFVVQQQAAVRELSRARERLLSDTEISHEILATAPDGLFLWVVANGSEACSRRLAVMLGLENGVRSTFDEVLSRLAPTDGKTLSTAAAKMRLNGETFELLLSSKDGLRRMLVVGQHAGTTDGEALADLLWMRDVTDLAPPKESAKASARDIIDTLPFPVWLRGSGLAVQIANRLASSLGAPDISRDLAERARESGGPEMERHLLTSTEGKPRFVDISETPLLGGGSLGVAQDHTRTEEMEGDFTRHIQAQNQVMETLATAIAIFDGNGKLTFFNSAYADLWGLKAEWLENEPTLGAVLDRLRDIRKLPEVVDYRAFKAGQLGLFGTLSGTIEEMLHLPDGTALRGLISPHPLGGLVFAFEDVTDHLDLERSYKTLSLVQRETIDNLYEAVAVFGGDGRMKLCNPAFAKTWKISPDAPARGLHTGDFVDHIMPMIRRQEGTSPLEREPLLNQLMGRNNTRGRIELTDATVLEFATVALPDGAALLSYLNVTDSARVEEALIERARSMAEANLLKSEFLAGVSHEIRTPLNAIIGFADILAQGYFGELTPRQKEYSRGIQESAEELVSIIEDTLDLATVEAGLMTLELDTVDINTLIGSTMNLVRDRARLRDIKLTLDCPANIGWLVADEKRMKQSLFNLISNAIQATPPGGSVAVVLNRDKGSIVIRITDGGTGMNESDIPPGVALVSRFIELHGGTVTLESKPGHGTAVICRLPADAGRREDDQQPDLFANLLG